MDKIKVMVFPAGAENALEIYHAIKDNVNIEVFGASGKSDHASFVYDPAHYYEDDFYINSNDFISKFSSLLKRLQIDVLIPTHDTIALYFAEHAEQFPVRILTATKKTALICREKRLTYQLFKNYEFCPQIYTKENWSEMKFPVFAKPNIGEGAKGTLLVNSPEKLADINKDTMILCEYLPGDEYTVDCFTNRNGQLLFAGIRTRERIQMGIAFRSKTMPMPPEIHEMAQIINDNLNFLGGWFFQVKKDSQGRYKLMEISCRMAGTMTLYRHKGINFSLLGIFELMGIQTTYVELPCEIALDRCLDAQYLIPYEYEHVYLDYDDTLTQNSHVNSTVITYLYQCKKYNKKVTLLTRHDGDLDSDLERLCIHKNLFAKIIHLSFDEEKTAYIDPANAIFIDNSFLERKKISDHFGIPVFDVDAVDALIKK